MFRAVATRDRDELSSLASGRALRWHISSSRSPTLDHVNRHCHGATEAAVGWDVDAGSGRPAGSCPVGVIMTITSA